MKRALLVIVLTAVVGGVAGVREAAALCVTDGQGPCYRYWQVDTVFVAKVIDKRPINEDVTTIDGAIAVLRDSEKLTVLVVEAFRGVERGAKLALFAPEGVCGAVGSQDGGEVFIYASRNKTGELWAQGCGVSGPLEEKGDDLAYARSVSEHGPSAIFYGDVVQREDDRDGNAEFTPMSRVRVRVRGMNFSAETETDASGKYSVNLPGAGRYSAEVIAPAGFANRFGDAPVEFTLPDRRSCFHESFQLQLNGRIRGRVIDAEGEPVANLVVRDGADRRSSKTDETGAFDIGPIEEGVYSLKARTGTNEWRFADAGLAAVVAGHVTNVPVVKMPEGLNLVTLSINVTAPADAGDAHVVVDVGGYDLGDPIEIDAGTIQFLVERDVSFNITAATQTHEARATVRSSSQPTGVTLSLRPKRSPR